MSCAEGVVLNLVKRPRRQPYLGEGSKPTCQWRGTARSRPCASASANASPEAYSEVDLRSRTALFGARQNAGSGGGHVALMDDIGLIFHRTLVGGSKCHHRYKRLIAVLGYYSGCGVGIC